jgi:hypothetical protein
MGVWVATVSMHHLGFIVRTPHSSIDNNPLISMP